MTDNVMTKDDIRKQILAKRDSYTEAETEEKSRKIFEILTGIREYQNATDVLIYASTRSEVVTDDIILDCLSEGKRVFCPKVTDRKASEMKFVRIYSPEDLKEGYFGIREPEIGPDSEIYGEASPKSAGKLHAASVDADREADVSFPLMIMPGVAFDRKRGRIGYGGGFYDRYLAGSSGISTIALCFDCQIYDGRLPLEPEDLRPDSIITCNEIISAGEDESQID